MAWKRGTQNNLPGEIRKGHIKEFLFPSLKKASVSSHLRIIELPDCEDFRHSATALVSKNIPECFAQFLVDGSLFIHSHDHPRCVLKAFLDDSIPEGHIALNETQRINSKVCIGELQEWTIYQGRTIPTLIKLLWRYSIKSHNHEGNVHIWNITLDKRRHQTALSQVESVLLSIFTISSHCLNLDALSVWCEIPSNICRS